MVSIPPAPAPKKRSLSDIKASLLRPSLTSYFECYFPPPPAPCNNFIKEIVKYPDIQDLLILSCSDASLPGSSLTTHELNNDVTGVSQKHAYRRLYDDRADFSFYVTLDDNHSYSQILFFERWIQFISGEQNATALDLFYPYRVQYPKSYKSSIYITKFERNANADKKLVKEKSQKIVYTFINAFPVSVQSIPVSYESSQLLKITVSFTYDRYNVSDKSLVPSTSSTSEPTQNTATGVTNPYGQITPETQSLFNKTFANIDKINLVGNGEVYQFNTNQITGINISPF
jgi:hypothetical protein